MPVYVEREVPLERVVTVEKRVEVPVEIDRVRPGPCRTPLRDLNALLAIPVLPLSLSFCLPSPSFILLALSHSLEGRRGKRDTRLAFPAHLHPPQPPNVPRPAAGAGGRW